jgi:flagellar biosynthesis protein FlhF
MKIKRYFAANMRQAIRQVREEQGADAVILSTRQVQGGIEIISAVDYDQDLIAEMAQRGERPETPLDETPEDPGTDTRPRPRTGSRPTGGGIEWTQDPAISEMRAELRSMRGLLQNQLSRLAWKDYQQRKPAQARALRRLMAMGLDAELAAEITDATARIEQPDRAWQAAMATLAERIPACAADLQPGVLALVGPTGVGKTTTVAKLAARLRVRHGAPRIAMVSTDAYRIGAQRQLATYAQILGVPLYAAESAEELRRILGALAEETYVLVDTAGLSQRDARVREQMDALAETDGVDALLVLAANAQRHVLEEAAEAFSPRPLRGCVITKLDEAAEIGGALSVAIGRGLSVHYTSDGQRVPEDLHLARAERLVAWAASLSERQGPEDDLDAPFPYTEGPPRYAHV